MNHGKLNSTERKNASPGYLFDCSEVNLLQGMLFKAITVFGGGMAQSAQCPAILGSNPGAFNFSK